MTSAIDPATVPLLPTKDTFLRLRHFSDTVYKKDQNSVLFRYMDAIVGDAGVGTLKKELLISRLSASLDTTYFSDLDNVFGNMASIGRLTSEQYGVNPTTGKPIDPSLDLLTTDQWDQIRIKDAWYRARIKTFFTALALGGTPDGLRMMVKSALGVDADIYEMANFQDHYARIYGITDIETITNLAITPSFERGLGQWIAAYATGGSLTVDNTFSGADTGDGGVYAARLITGTSSSAFTSYAITSISLLPPITNGFPYTPSLQIGKTYNASLTYYWPSANTLSGLTISVIFYNSSAVETSRTNLNVTPTVNSRTRANLNFTMPVGTYYVNFAVFFNGNVTSTSQTVYFDSVKISAGSSATAYFDGDTSGYRWTGTVGLSPSVLASPIDAVSRLRTPSRSEIIIYPHKSSISVYEAQLVRKFLKRLAPVDSVITVPSVGFGVNIPLVVDTALSDSTYFQVNSYVTGFAGSALTPAQEPNASYRWVKNGIEVKAPTMAFGEAQEYSEYYYYSTDAHSSIDSVTYTSESPTGAKFSEGNYKIVSKSVNAWGEWTFFDTADSPDNFPGGKNGKTPTKAPALTKAGKPYIFPYKSQQTYVAAMKLQVAAAGGQARTLSQETPLDRLVFTAPISAGQTTDTQYRLPLSATENVLNTWTPDEAIANQPPVIASTVTSGWYSRTSSPGDMGA